MQELVNAQQNVLMLFTKLVYNESFRLAAFDGSQQNALR